MPSVRAARIPAPQCDITKTDPTTVTTATSAWAGAFHGTVDLVPSVGFETGELGNVVLYIKRSHSKDLNIEMGRMFLNILKYLLSSI